MRHVLNQAMSKIGLSEGAPFTRVKGQDRREGGRGQAMTRTHASSKKSWPLYWSTSWYFPPVAGLFCFTFDEVWFCFTTLESVV